MKLDSLRHLLVKELHDLYSAETQLVKAMPRIAKAAHSPELKSALTEHLAVTKDQVRRLEQIFTELGETTNGTRCKGMAGLIKEGQDLLKEPGDPAVLDAALITAAQKIEHYEIAGYGSARTYANMLRLDNVAELLQQTLNEEGTADETLTELAEATLSIESEPERVDDIAMHGDTEPGGVDMPGYEQALEREGRLRNGPLEAGGTGAHWETDGPPDENPAGAGRS